MYESYDLFKKITNVLQSMFNTNENALWLVLSLPLHIRQIFESKHWTSLIFTYTNFWIAVICRHTSHHITSLDSWQPSNKSIVDVVTSSRLVEPCRHRNKSFLLGFDPEPSVSKRLGEMIVYWPRHTRVVSRRDVITPVVSSLPVTWRLIGQTGLDTSPRRTKRLSKVVVDWTWQTTHTGSTQQRQNKTQSVRLTVRQPSLAQPRPA